MNLSGGLHDHLTSHPLFSLLGYAKNVFLSPQAQSLRKLPGRICDAVTGVDDVLGKPHRATVSKNLNVGSLLWNNAFSSM
jgi:hypothetical protein